MVEPRRGQAQASSCPLEVKLCGQGSHLPITKCVIYADFCQPGQPPGALEPRVSLGVSHRGRGCLCGSTQLLGLQPL